MFKFEAPQQLLNIIYRNYTSILKVKNLKMRFVTNKDFKEFHLYEAYADYEAFKKIICDGNLRYTLLLKRKNSGCTLRKKIIFP